MNTQTSKAAIDEAALDELHDLVKRAKAGDRTVLPRLRQYLDANRSLWRVPGDIAVQAEGAWITLIAGPDLHLRECLVRRANEMKYELLGDSPTPIESLLVERVVTAWLQLGYIEAREAQKNEVSIRWVEFKLKRQVQAERQLRAAIQALDTCRRASRPISVEIRQSAVVPSELPIVPAVANGDAPEFCGDSSRQTTTAANTRFNGVNRMNGHHNRLEDLLEPVTPG